VPSLSPDGVDGKKGDASTVTEIKYDGTPLSPVVKGTVLVADPGRVDAQLRQMIIEHGQAEMSTWVDGLQGSLTGGVGYGDIGGAPDPDMAFRLSIVSEFKASRTRWGATIEDIQKRFDQEITGAVNALLDAGEKEIHKEATRYGMSLDPTGNKIRQGGLSF